MAAARGGRVRAAVQSDPLVPARSHTQVESLQLAELVNPVSPPVPASQGPGRHVTLIWFDDEKSG